MKLISHAVILASIYIILNGCSYTLTSSYGVRVNSAQVQQIKLGRTTEIDLMKLLGPPSRKARMLGGSERLLYESTEVSSLTLPWGYQARGLLDRENDELFEVILKDGVVQSYRYLTQ